MAPRHRTATFISLLIAFLYILGSVSAQKPEVSLNTFHNFPARLFFFDDSTSVIYFDAQDGIVYVSQDEGKSWSAADIPKGEAAMVIEHPFDNTYAFVLTKGTKHYRTQDRGKTWQSFDLPIPPAFVPFPLSFHSDKASYGLILYQGTKCEKSKVGWGSVCHDETYYTKDAFSSDAALLLADTSRCQFAHGSKDFKHEAPHDLVFCVAFDSSASDGAHSLASSRLFSSTDFFRSDKQTVDLGIGRNARGVLALAIVSKFAVVALKDMSAGAGGGDMLLYVSVDAKTWAKAHFPHSSSATLRENAYTIVESTTHSLAVDVLLHQHASLGTLFVSNSNGTFFVESLKDTNRNDMGFVDYENIYGVEGVGLANVVRNSRDVQGRGVPKQLQTRITFDDGRSWSRIRPPSTGADGKRIHCDPHDDDCSLHLHSVTNPHNFGRVFSSPAPGFVMGVGSIGDYLRPYEECDTFLSTDAGQSWSMVREDAHKYEFGDQGSVLVVVNDEDGVDAVRYSSDLGKKWKKLDIGIKLRARALTTVPDSTSQKFILVGQIARKDQKGDGRVAVVFLDFAPMRSRQCDEDDFEKWYARGKENHECVMGHKQWYRRRKPDRDCYVGHKFDDPVEHEENCPCTPEDYECDYNFIRNGDKCVPAGPEPIPAGVCKDGTGKYMGSSGYRLIPGNTCDKGQGSVLDAPVEKDCSKAQPEEGQVTHQLFEFPSEIVQYSYFKESTTILVRLNDNSIYQSRNEGYTWERLFPEETFVAFYMHSYSRDRAYLITPGKKFYYTTDTATSWHVQYAPTVPNTFGAIILHFHPTSDYLIWTGDEGCDGGNLANCHTLASYSLNNGRSWDEIERYVRNCAWARDAELRVDSTQVICESYRDKTGNQRSFHANSNPLQLVGGGQFFQNKRKLFDRVVGFAKFSEFLIVAEYLEDRQSLDLQVSLDGRTFATGIFPASLRPQNHAYTILESSTKAVFLHLTTSEFPRPFWGVIMKSNGNGTYFGISVDNVNRNERGYVDFEKMIGLDGIALINVVSNPDQATITGRKELQTRITHNDGGTWKPLVPPKVDAFGQAYECSSTKCALQVHGYTERYDSRATYSTPSVPGLMMAVGNVGETLAPYKESDTFLSRDGGFTWQEVHKDAHLWEFGDYGSVLVMANDEEPTDHVLFSTDEGDTWRTYTFSSQQKVRVKSVVTVPSDTSRRFILFGYYPHSLSSAVAIHLDFSSLTRRQCVLDEENPTNDDFEFWSPAESRQERCLFGRQTLYHRRIRNAQCYVGNQPRIAEKVVETCPCASVDFECEFNHVRNADGNCVLVEGAQKLPDDDTCEDGQEFWYERTAYRKIPFSSCEGGLRWHQGAAHRCPGVKGHGFFFWVAVLFFPSALAALVGYWYYRRHGLARGTIRLPGDNGPAYRATDSGIVATLASVPWFIVGVVGIAWERLSRVRWPWSGGLRTQRGYRTVAVDEDAQVLRFEDED